eukprot:gb/GFBE01045928.1/.p1 GENE.gb/GFBE01045928.1/~~gb/GFBE01045928.1/.p1  ORF type:complete len:161 (+),score=46.98 gb/GFBE01045928.1/:1-483(+)
MGDFNLGKGQGKGKAGCVWCARGECWDHGMWSPAKEAEYNQMMAVMMKGMMNMFKGKGKGKFGKGKLTPKGMNAETGEVSARKNPDADMEGKPGPNGEDPSTGRWSFESKGKGAAKRWKWKPTNPEKELERAMKRAKHEAREAEEAAQAAAAAAAAGAMP